MEEQKPVTKSVRGTVLALLGSFVGLVLAVVGVAIGSSNIVYAGIIILPLSLIAGGIMLKEENGIVRAGMLIAAGLILAQAGVLGGMLSRLL